MSPPKRLSAKRILIVEDDLMMQETLAELIASEGAITSVAENGTIAFEMIKQERFDAVISDIRMPGGSGVILARNILQLPVRPHFFICSGFNDLKSEDLSPLNISEVFEKPFDIEKMITRLETHLTHSE